MGAGTAEMTVQTPEMVFRGTSPQAFIDQWRESYGPTLKSFEAVGDAGRAALEADMLELIARFNRADDGAMVVPNTYLEAVIVKR